MIKRSLSLAVFVFLALSTTAVAEVILDTGTLSLSAADSTQLSRLSRSGVPSDWSVSKVFPGTLNPTTSYHFRTFTVTPPTDFLQVSVDDPTAVLFASAYLTSYNPASLSTGYLGDAGFTGDEFNNPGYFQLHVTAGTPIILVVNDGLAASGGLGHPFRLIVEAFTDTLYTEEFIDVSSRVSVTTNGFVRNRSTGLWTATMTVTNTSAQTIVGPVDVIITNLTPGDTMTNNTGFTGTPPQPYIRVTSGNISAGGSVNVPITFTNPSNGFINFTPVTRATQ